MGITVTLILIAGFLVGFIPERLKSTRLNEENASLQSRMANLQQEEDLSNFKVRAALIYIEAVKNNFSIAAGSASSFFTDLRQYTDHCSDAALKQQFDSVLMNRDNIIAGLAKADPAIAGQLQSLFMRMQDIQASHLPNSQKPH
jgi:phage-related protein